MKDKKILFGTFIALLLLLTTGLSYAYFSASINGNENAKNVVVEAGTLKLTYTDGPVINAQYIKPGWSITKEVSVKNTGTLDTAYNIVWQELTNEIINDELVLSATCERVNSEGIVDGTCNSILQAPISSNTIKKNISIESGITHKYTFTITFKETNSNQNYNQGKKFSGVLGINEFKINSPVPTYCTYDGELTQGAKYVNGQYTYYYGKERTLNFIDELNLDIVWRDLNEDGWSVQLTDNTSTDPVTSALCTYINNKPVISMSSMFAASKATSIDLSSFNTSKVTNMNGMFADSQVTTLDVSNFDTSKVIDMSGMFYGNYATKLDVSGFNTSRVTNMRFMYFGSQTTTLDVSNYDTSKVTDMVGMFAGSQATTLDVSNFDTSKVTDMVGMFAASKVTSLDLSSFNTSNVTNMQGMFRATNITFLDVSNFDTSKVTNMSHMFEKITNLKTIYVSSKFNTDIVTDSTDMFEKCTSLVGGSGTTYDSSHIDKTYARIDGGEASPGYFTAK